MFLVEIYLERERVSEKTTTQFKSWPIVAHKKLRGIIISFLSVRCANVDEGGLYGMDLVTLLLNSNRKIFKIRRELENMSFTGSSAAK